MLLSSCACAHVYFPSVMVMLISQQAYEQQRKKGLGRPFHKYNKYRQSDMTNSLASYWNWQQLLHLKINEWNRAFLHFTVIRGFNLAIIHMLLLFFPVVKMGTMSSILSCCHSVFLFSVTLIVTVILRVFYPSVFGRLKFSCNVLILKFWVLCLFVLCPCTIWFIIVPLRAHKSQNIHLPQYECR